MTLGRENSYKLPKPLPADQCEVERDPVVEKPFISPTPLDTSHVITKETKADWPPSVIIYLSFNEPIRKAMFHQLILGRTSFVLQYTAMMFMIVYLNGCNTSIEPFRAHKNPWKSYGGRNLRNTCV